MAEVKEVGLQTGKLSCHKCGEHVCFSKQLSHPHSNEKLDWGTMLYLGSEPVGYRSSAVDSVFEAFGAKTITLCYSCRFITK